MTNRSIKIVSMLVVFNLNTIAFAKEEICTALLNGHVTLKNVEPIFDPEVFYPNDPLHPRLAKWVGSVTVNKFLPPFSAKITCGKPFAHVKFGALSAQGTMPQAIETLPWIGKAPNGDDKIVPPELLSYVPTTYDYPLPLLNFEDAGDRMFEILSPDGTSDICSFKNIDLPDFEMITTMKPDWDASYSATTIDGNYRWYSDGFGKLQSPKILVEKPQIKIVCDDTWTYDAEFKWPYIIDETTPLYGICPGSVERTMKIHGEFAVMDENKVVGYFDISKPIVSSAGSITGDYSGSSFSMYVEGKVYTDSTGKAKLDLPWFRGGHGVSWKYTWTCADWGTITNSLPGAVNENFKVINYSAETENPDNPGHVSFDADGEEKTLPVDMDGQGIVTFTRKLQKNK